MESTVQPIVVITGVSRGLGREIAIELHNRNFFVVGIVRRFSDQVQSWVTTQLEWDLSQPWNDKLQNELSSLLRGKIPWGVVHAAGTLGWGKYGEQLYEEAFAVNVKAGISLANAFLEVSHPGFQAHSKVIAHISSGAALKPYLGLDAYCISKAAMWMYFQLEAKRHLPTQAAFLSLAPGTLKTDMMAQILSSSYEKVPDVNRFHRLQASGELIDPRRPASAIADLLASPSIWQKWHGQIWDYRLHAVNGR